MRLLAALLCFVVTSACTAQEGSQSATATKPAQEKKSGEAKGKEKKSEWIQLFNGKDLTGWTPKVRNHELGDNYADTFRVENGVLKVSYDKYDGPFNERFGHLFYKDKFSHYILRVEYRFVGKQHAGGPGWAYRNSGLMLHGEDPRGMTKDQDFPVSIEVQLLGSDEKVKNHTCNLCTPGTNVVMKGKLNKQHCFKSSSNLFPGEQWVTAEVEVRGSEYIRHKVNGKVVLEYKNPQFDPRAAVLTRKDPKGHLANLIKKNDGNLLIEGGTISLQSESHPCEFRKVELKVLKKAR